MQLRSIIGILLCSISLCAVFVSPSSVAQDLFEYSPKLFDMPDRSSKRAAFLRAEKRIWRMDDDDLANALKEIGSYPLAPYLIERKLSDKPRLSDVAKVRVFLRQYEGTPLARKLRRNWLDYLAEKNEAALFIEFYKATSNAKLACTFLDFQIIQGVEITKMFGEISSLWTVGKSQPKECDRIFELWIKADELTEDLVLLRIKKAADGGRHTLIPYLRKLLPVDQQYLADLWHKTRKDPATVRNTELFTGKYPLIEAEIVSYGLSRLIWRDDALAISVMEKAETRITFTQAQKARIYGKFGIKLAIDNHKDSEKWLLKAAEVDDDSSVMRWHLAYLLRQKDWARIVLLIENAPAQSVSANEYSYWLARSYEQLGRTNEANVLYKQLAEHRHYYGFLSSVRVNQPYQLQHIPAQVPISSIKKVLSLASSQRAYELRKLGRNYEARLEWRHTQGLMSEEDKLATSIISSAWEWHDQAIFTFAREGYLDDVVRRFPTAFEDVIVREAKKNKIDPEWAFAIARRESSFMPDAVSSANARGLMQVLPSTAKYLEKRRVSSRQLFDVETNAKIGNKYLRYLMDKLNDNSILATASYNAGWRRVKQWLPENEALESDIWVELIPYRETRNYVKAITAYKQIYNAQLNGHVTMPNEIASAKANVFVEFIGTDIPVSL